MKKLISALFTFVIVVTFTACKKENKANVAKDVYVSGYTVANNVTRACYWKNGSIILLGDGLIPSQANDIKVASNGDVYVCGTIKKDPDIAVYWKNGVQKNITDGINNAEAFGIYVTGDSVFIAGSQYYDQVLSPVYWYRSENNMPGSNNFFTGQGGAFYDITFANNKIFACGYEIYNGNNVPLYIDNGFRNLLANSNKYGNAKSIVVDNNIVYIAGNISNSLGGIDAVYWQNNTQINLTNNEQNANTNGIVRANAFTYLVGNVHASNLYVCAFWKKKSAVDPSNGSGLNTNQKSNIGADVKVIGEDIFVVATETDITNTPIVYKNTAPTRIVGNDAIATGLWVTEQ
jgi:hypothetical protein